MTKITSFVVVVVVLATVLAATQSAEGRTRWRRSSRTTRPAKPTATHAMPAPSYPTRYRGTYPSAYYYPKYTGAFHARYYDGIPSIYGSHPMRGTAW